MTSFYVCCMLFYCFQNKILVFKFTGFLTFIIMSIYLPNNIINVYEYIVQYISVCFLSCKFTYID